MAKYKIINLIVCSALCLGALTGCGVQTTTDSSKSPYAAVVSMEGTPVIEYIVPQFTPNVLVDIQGYCIGGNMEAVVKGKNLPEEFSLIEKDSGETVYTGRIERVTFNEEMGLYAGHANFSEMEEPGEYYLQCDIIGQSYGFSIEEGLYTRLFEESCASFIEKCGDGSLTLEEGVAILQTYEWYSEQFPDEDGDEIPDVLEEIRKWVSYMEEKGVEASEEALYAALLAKFGYAYQKIDIQYATDCLKRASTVYGQLQNTISRDMDSFFALTELYRATGLYTYRNQISDYKSFFENSTSYLEQTGYCYGAMTYLVTRQKVDMEMCEMLMNRLMERAEEISLRYEDMIHPVTAKNNGSEDLLKSAMIVSCANFCMNNYQYTNICADFVHYLMGRNQDSVNFYSDMENRSGYLLLLAQLAANEGKM